MNRYPLLPLAGLLFFAPACRASAQTPQVHDLHCLLAMGALQTNADPNVKSAGVMGSLYFLGKVVATEPNIDLGSQLASEAAKLKGQSTRALLDRCLQEYNARSQQLIATSNRVSAALD
jgi:hypothetical protein